VYNPGSMLQLAHEIQELMEAEARDALASGWAEMRIEENDVGPSLHLEPVKLECAPLEVYFDSSQLVICSPGRKGMSCEFFSEHDPEEIKTRVHALVAAIVGGKYVERYRQGTSELRAEWPGPDGTEEGLREALITSGGGGGDWHTVDYEPY
jgi:hypothetical protein